MRTVLRAASPASINTVRFIRLASGVTKSLHATAYGIYLHKWPSKSLSQSRNFFSISAVSCAKQSLLVVCSVFQQSGSLP